MQNVTNEKTPDYKEFAGTVLIGREYRPCC